METKHQIELIISRLACIFVVGAAGCGQSEYLGPVADSRVALEIRDSFGVSTDGGGAVAEVATGTGWATLKGRFTFQGDPPSMSPYSATKDQSTCAPGGKAPLQEKLVVDSSTSGIKNIAVYLRKASRVHESTEPGGEKVVFDQKTCMFLSHVLPVTVGQTVELKNSDRVGHNTNISGKNAFNQIIPKEASLDFVPQKEEAVPVMVNCSIHPWMVAYMLPRKNSYYAVTSGDGSFEIVNLPAGEELEIQVWHESATGAGGGLVLSTPEAKELKWSKKGRFKIKLEADSTQELDFAVPATAFRG